MLTSVTFRCMLIALACAASISVHAMADSPRRVDVPAGDLTAALRTLATQLGIEFMYSAEQLKGLKTAGVQGEFTAEKAVTKLLEGTKLTVTVHETGALLISNASAAGSTPLLEQQHSTEGLRLAQQGPSAAMARGVDSLQSRTTANASSEDSTTSSSGFREEVIGEVVVTGTHIRGVTTSSSPLMVFDRDDIARTGLSTVDQFMERLPQTLGSVGQDTLNAASIDAATNFGDGTSINLRGLSGKSTLVLINGRRLAPGGFFGSFVDASLVPLAAVERIEILTDGASAIYGSDAVAGVVNFIMRSDYEGAETALEFGSVTDGDMAAYRAAQSLGARWNAGSALISYEYSERDGLEVQERDFIPQDIFFPSTSLLGAQDRHNVLASVRHELSDRFELFADALYSDRDTERNPQGPADQGFLGSSATTKQAQGSLGGRYRLSGSWSAQAIASYSDYQLDATSSGIDLSTDADLGSLDALVDGALLHISGGALRLAVGSSYRRENFSSIGQTAVTSTIAPERSVTSVFSELHVPLVSGSNRRTGIEALELSIAARYEDYSDFGDDVTPKVGIRWEPIASLNLRATYGESFKAPDLNSVYSPEIVTVTNYAGLAPDDPLVLQRDFGNPNLTAETARSWTVGFDWRPEWAPLSMTVTYYDIEFDDRITVPAINVSDIFIAPEQFGELLIEAPGAALVNSLIANAAAFVNQAGPDLAPAEFDPDDVDLAFDNRQHNIASEEQSGFDVMLDYPFEATWGNFGLSLNATYVTSFDRQTTPTGPVREILNIPESTIDLKARAGLEWSLDALGASLFLNYQDGYRDVDAERTPISSLTTFDLTLRYAGGRTDKGGLSDGLNVSLAITNLLDEDPPRALLFALVPYYDTANGDPVGRFVRLLVSKKW